jgi:hypothetical protein
VSKRVATLSASLPLFLYVRQPPFGPSFAHTLTQVAPYPSKEYPPDPKAA